MEELRRHLLAQAFLYDSPEAYASGVEAALHAVEQRARGDQQRAGGDEQPASRDRSADPSQRHVS